MKPEMTIAEANLIPDTRQTRNTERGRRSERGGLRVPDSELRSSQLKDACCNFEGMLVATILKQGMKSSFEEETDGGHGAMQEFALEQTARELARAGAFGISDMLYEQLSGRNSDQPSFDQTGLARPIDEQGIEQ